MKLLHRPFLRLSLFVVIVYQTKTLEERIKLYEDLAGVNNVIVQWDSLKEGPGSAIGQNILDCLDEYGGKHIEVGYKFNLSVCLLYYAYEQK